MHIQSNQPHYSPVSVALMDPSFVRDAASDAHGGHRAERTPSATLGARWRIAMHAIASALRRH